MVRNIRGWVGNYTYKIIQKKYISIPVFLAACNDSPTVLEPRAMNCPVQSHLLN